MMNRSLLAALLVGALASTTPGQQARPRVIDEVVTDVDGRVLRLGSEDGLKAVALVFVDVGCPIVRRYLPRLNEMAQAARKSRAQLFGVLSDDSLTWQEARSFRDEYGVKFPLLFDANGVLANKLKPTVVPEAFVFDHRDVQQYRGRIDDWFAAPGKPRKTVSSHDLLEAIEATAAGNKPKVAQTQPVGCEFEGTSAALPDTIDWARHVAPILNAQCVECHRKGAIGPFALDTYPLARRRAKMIARVVEDNRMPPWHAHEGHAAFRGERVLTAREKAVLRAWADAGAPQGDAEDAPPKPAPPTSGWALGKPDFEVAMTEPFDVPADGDDIYRYFVIPREELEQRAVVAFDFRPGDPSVVHHCIAYVDFSGKSRKLDAKDEQPGFALFDGGGDLAEKIGDEMAAIGGWAPGMLPYKFPKGHAIQLPPGGDLVLEIHYHLTGKATKDQSSIAFYYADEPVEHWVESIVLGTLSVDIPAGAANYWRHVSMRVPADFSLLDIGPHMHFLGKECVVRATLPDGKTMSLLSADWDFRWQGVYIYREPLHIPKGTRIDAWFRFDNSAANPDNQLSPPQRVRWGWQSTEEMCQVYLTLVPERAKDFKRIERASYGSWMQSAKPKTNGPPWRKTE